MKTYTFHAPALAEPGNPDALERAELVPDRFGWMAFAFTFLWFFFKRLWLAGIAVLVFLAVLHGALNLLNVHPAAIVASQFLAALLIGFEANSLRRWTLTRRGFPARAVVLAKNADEAEAKAFARWLDGSGEVGLARVPARPARIRGPAPQSAGSEMPVLGLFPEPERGR